MRLGPAAGADVVATADVAVAAGVEVVAGAEVVAGVEVVTGGATVGVDTEVDDGTAVEVDTVAVSRMMGDSPPGVDTGIEVAEADAVEDPSALAVGDVVSVGSALAGIVTSSPPMARAALRVKPRIRVGEVVMENTLLGCSQYPIDAIA